MTFAAPAWLAALALVPVLLAVYLRRARSERSARAAFTRPAVAPSVMSERLGWRRHAVPALIGGALALLAVALARPQRTVAVPLGHASVMLLTDRSGSMAASDVTPTRLDAARAAAARFLATVPPSVRVGAIVFNHTAQLLVAPTQDRAAVRAALSPIRPAGSTATGEALELALHSVRAPAAIVLLSDGGSARGRDPFRVAREARGAHVSVYTVSLGTPAGTLRGRPVPVEPETLRRIAALSGGRSYAAADAGRLQAVYADLGHRLGTTQRKRELTAGVTGGALALVALAALISLRWFRRIL